MKHLLIALPLFLFLFSCKKDNDVKPIEQSVAMDLISADTTINSAIQSIEIPNPRGGCGAGQYQSMLYDGNSTFMLSYGYDGYNLNYAHLDSYTGSFKWMTDHQVWGYDHLSGQIYGDEYYIAPGGSGSYYTSVEFSVIPNSCIVHYKFNHNIMP